MSDENFRAVAEVAVACKVCGHQAKLFGVVDFNKNCEIVHGRKVLEPCGIPVYYHRCTACQFLFTTFTDGWTHEEFVRHLYNAEYALVDPEYADVRPRQTAQGMNQLWGKSKDIRILDYGGGNGVAAKVMREMGFANVETYDPFTPEFAGRPAGKFDLIVSIEVLEHSPTPKETVADMAGMLAEQGVMTVSTLTQPQDIDALGVNWWYLAPRNGHVSLYSGRALGEVARPLGLTWPC